MTIIDEIKNFLREKEYLNHNNSIGDSESLLENGIIDSVGIAELVAFLEKKYNIQIDEDDLMPENFDSFEAIKNYVNSKNT
jgi:acyl carrier protein